MPSRALSSKWFLPLTRLLGALRFGGAVLLSALLARLWLFWQLRRVDVTPFMFDPRCCSTVQLAYWAREDVVFAVWCTALALPVCALGLLLARLQRRGAAPHGRGWQVLPVSALCCIGLLHAVYYKVAFVMHAQLDSVLLNEAWQNGFGWEDLLEHLEPVDVLLVFNPVLVYCALRAASRRALALQSLGLVSLAALLLLLPDPGRSRPWPELQVNPVSYLVQDAAAPADEPRAFAELDVQPSPGDLAAMGLAEIPAAPAPASAGSNHPVNVVMVILESVGSRYAFAGGADPIMPRLSALRASSLFFAQHVSPSNSSTNSLFSIFTGLYPAPSRVMFATRADVHLPVLSDHLPWIEDAFLVTPGRLNSYFPRGLLKNAELELTDRYNLGIAQPRPAKGPWAADERDGVDAFLARLQRATVPFFGVYYSYAAHKPYYDHGPEFRVMPDLDNDLQRYQNNLRLLDVQLGRILEAIHARPEPTLLVVLGDHGQAFGQHPSNFTHSTQSYQENFETFALVNLPGTFPARVIQARTSHVDLAPTILAGLGVPFDAASFQGRNALEELSARPFVFLYGNEDTVSSIAASGAKLQLRYKRHACRVFELSVDPEERQPLSCGAYPEQERYTGMFHAFQPQALQRLQHQLSARPKTPARPERAR